MSKDTDRTVYRRASDKKWVDKLNDASKGFVFLTVKGRDGLIRSKDTLGGGNDPNPLRDREH